MKKKMLFILFFVGVIMNGEVFAAGAKQEFKIRLRVVDPLRVDIGSMIGGDEVTEINGHHFNIVALKGANVEVSLEDKGTILKNKNGKEVEVEGLVKIEGIEKTKTLGVDEGIRGVVDLRVKEKTVGSRSLEGEYAGAMMVNVNYN